METFELSSQSKLKSPFPRLTLEMLHGKEDWDLLGSRILRDVLSSGSPLISPDEVDPVVSIVVVLHNKAHISVLCILSVLQTVTVPYQLLIVDNASTDGTSKVLDLCHGATLIKNSTNRGFGEACMQAVAQAKGRFLLFLNNDALLDCDGVSVALRNFDDPAVGAVGGKILLADGKLQEAGSIIWCDGSALGYGRFRKPEEPEFCFRRPVDYCSGAYLFTPSWLFREVGGFDSAYAPAYYEDTDYCMKVWQAGFRVVFDPRTVVRHYESATSGGNEAAQLLMATKQRVFFSKWSATLEQHQAPAKQHVLKARIASQSSGLRIMYLDDRIPHRKLGSGYPRSNAIVRELVRLGHHVTCVPVSFPFQEVEKEYADIDRDVELYDISDGDDRLYSEYLPLSDVVWISRPHNLTYFLEKLVDFAELRGKLVYDAEAVFTDRDRLRTELFSRRVPSKLFETRLRREFALAHVADAVVVVSRHDQQRMNLAGIENVHVLGHSLPPSPTMRPYNVRKDILFLGAVHGSDNPNADSVRYFCREIWPLVKHLTGAQFTIAGFGTDIYLADLQSSDVKVIGPVEEVRSLYASARVVVVPTRYAAGIPFKAHEAAAYGVPMVVSQLISEQLCWEPGRDMLVGKSAQEFASACCHLYTDKERWSAIRGNALTRIICEFDQKSFECGVAAVLESVTN